MIKLLLIEDEIPARKKIKRFIEELELPIELIAEIDNVEEAIDFLKVKQPDLILSDIELLDGNAFEIYKHVQISCPIIFTTAYDQFWMDAFDSNGIAYLLKPFSKDRFQKAWDKFMLLTKESMTEARKGEGAENEGIVNESQQSLVINRLTQLIQQSFAPKSYKKRFTINTTLEFYFLETSDILFFIAEEGVVFAQDNKNKKHLLTESTLKEIEEVVNPEEFFRINRSELIAKEHIEKIERYSKNALAVKMRGSEHYLKTSQSATAAFRQWVEK